MPNHVPCILTLRAPSYKEVPEDDETAHVDECLAAMAGPNPIFAESDYEHASRMRLNELNGRPVDFMPEPEIDILQCHNFIPVPPDILAQTYSDAGYDWCVENWGTKWGAYDCSLQRHAGDGPDVAIVTFNCAWKPCLPVVDALAGRFPLLHVSLEWCDPYDDQWFRKDWNPVAYMRPDARYSAGGARA